MAPSVSETSATTLDQFVLARLEQQNLTFAPPAERRVLCRRLYLDLTGLPPTPADVDLFLSDASDQAVENLVDRLLASPAYGERWGRQWLDVVGYADSNGYIRHDSPRPLAYRYRDYVVQSFNQDKPYDVFWREQLAGDELVPYHARERISPEEIQTLIATHYLRNCPDGTDNTEGNEITRVMERYAVLESLLQTTMSAMFGITIDCARCHDHKFDPIPQTDYYSLQAIFYPAFNVKDWVQPKDRWIYGGGSAQQAEWKASQQLAETQIADLRKTHQEWIAAHRPPGELVWQDDFSAASLADFWSAVARGDRLNAAIPRTTLDAELAPAADLRNGRLRLHAAAAGDSRWLATGRAFDWTPEKTGDWIQVTFDLVESQGPGGQPAERIGYYIALHDYDDDSSVPGGNLLFDGNPAGGANVVLDYPGSDQKGLGTIGTSGYLPGHNFGVRITNVGDDRFALEHLYDGDSETKSLTLMSAQLPDGAFGFELCCSRSFTVDHVVVEASTPSNKNDSDRIKDEFTSERERRQIELARAIAEINACRIAEPEKIAWVTDLTTTPPDVPVLKRGDYFQPGEPAAPHPLSMLTDDGEEFRVEPPDSTRTTGRRLAFARWATQPGSRPAALMARVQADRIWRGHFGRGLVPTPENFGLSGVGPTQPELLEWLASELVSQGWRQKALHRAIVLSRTYQQSSEAPPSSLERDASNSWYSRFPVHRLEAEQIRDSMLAVAGALNPRQGGPAVEPVDEGNRQVVLKASGDGMQDVDRRSIYVRYRRSQPLTFLRAFDQASPEPNCVSRGTSTIVSQSLALLNGEFSTRMGRAFARTILDSTTPDANESIRQAFQRAYLRPPSEDELNECQRFLALQIERRGGEDAFSAALADLCRLLLASNEFLYLQ